MKFFAYLLGLAALLAFNPSRAHAQGAWAYVELLHANSTAKEGDRWDASLVSLDQDCADVADGQDCRSLVVPKELVAGKEIKVILTGASAGEDGAIQRLTAANGEAACVQTGDSDTCLIRVIDLGVTREESDAYLASTVADPAKRKSAQVRAQVFLAKPVLRTWHGIH